MAFAGKYGGQPDALPNKSAVFRVGFCMFLALCAAVLCAACTGSPGARPGSPPEAGSLDVPGRAGIQHLVFIGFDGWGGDYVSKADMPTVKRMAKEGASSFAVQNVMPSSSWPNWSSLFYGTPPEQRSEEPFPSIFTVVKNSETARSAGRPSGAVLFYEWGDLDRICTAAEAEKRRINSSVESAREAAAYIREHKPRLTVVVFDQPDSTGHNKRWGSRAYYNKLTELDGFAAIIEEGVRDAGIYDTTVFVFSADHGGIFWGHGYDTPKQRHIPLVIYGAGIRKGYVIPQGEICDIAPTMAAILGLEAPPRWTGRVLEGIFE